MYEDAMDNKQSERSNLLCLQEISQQEFCDHFDDNDFFLAYGNPLIINCDSGSKIVAIAWPLAERMLRMAGRGDEADEVIRKCAEQYEQEQCDSEDDDRIKYWIYEFEMPDETRTEIETYCETHELTADEYFEAAVRYCMDLSRQDPEVFNKIRDEMQAIKEDEYKIRLVRMYPVYKGETEAQALKRKLAEEAKKS